MSSTPPHDVPDPVWLNRIIIYYNIVEEVFLCTTEQPVELLSSTTIRDLGLYPDVKFTCDTSVSGFKYHAQNTGGFVILIIRAVPDAADYYDVIHLIR